MFTIATIVAEFLPGGGIIPYYRFEIVRLLNHHDSMGNYLMIAEIFFALYIVYFIVNNLVQMKKMKTNYWKTYWTLAEWGVIGFSLLAFVFYAYR